MKTEDMVEKCLLAVLGTPWEEQTKWTNSLLPPETGQAVENEWMDISNWNVLKFKFKKWIRFANPRLKPKAAKKQLPKGRSVKVFISKET